MPAPAPITADELLAFMKARAPYAADEQSWATDCVDACWSAALSILAATVDPMPAGMLAELRVATFYGASVAYQRRQALFGTAAYVDPTSGSVVRVPADYIEAVRGILDRYSRFGFA